MEPLTIGVISLLVFIALLALGLHIAVALFLISLVGISIVTNPRVALDMLGEIPFHTMNDWLLACVPLFVIMGHFAGYAGFTADIFRTARLWLSRLPAGLGMASTVGCAAFGAATGSSLAAAAVMGKVMVPELRRSGYEVSFAMGVVAGSTPLASLIPPSIGMVIYGFLAEESIAKLFIGGYIPGIITVLAFSGMMYVRAMVNPDIAPRIHETVTWKERFVSLKGAWGIGLIALLVLGGLYTGVFTPTEVGAAGSLLAFIIALALRRVTRQNLRDSLLDAATVTARVFFIVIAAMFFGRFLVVTGLTSAISHGIIEFTGSKYVLITLLTILYVFMGMFIEPIGMMTITVPIFLPVVKAMGIDPVWFGIYIVVVCEIGLLTPPVGMNCYVLHSVVPDVPLPTIFKGITWFVVMDIVVIAILTAWPQLVLFLPGMMVR